MSELAAHLVWLRTRYGGTLSQALEDREDVVLTPDDAILLFSGADPTRHLRLTDWLVRTYVDKASFKLEDIRVGRGSTVGRTLTLFLAKRGTLPPDRRNINLYDSPGDLWQAVGGDVAPKPSKREDRDRARAESRILVDDERGIVAVPLTKFAACWWGRGTRWCTAAREDNAFHSYAESGPLFVLVIPDGSKAQFYAARDHSADFRDAADNKLVREHVSPFHELLDPVIRWSVDVSGDALQFGSPNLRQERSTVLMALRSNGGVMRYCSEDFLNDEEMVAAMIEGTNDGIHEDRSNLPGAWWALCKASRRLKGNRELVLAAVKRDGLALSNALAESRSDRELVLEAIRNNPHALEHASDMLKDDRDIVMEAVSLDGYALIHACTRYRDDRAIVLEAVRTQGDAWHQASPALQCDKEIVVAAVSQSRNVMAKVAIGFHEDMDVVMAAVNGSGRALEHVRGSLRTHPEVIAAALANDGMALEHLDAEARANRDIVLSAVMSSGNALFHADHGLCGDPVVVRKAVEQNGAALKWMDPSLWEDRELILAAMRQEGCALQITPLAMRNDREIVMAAVRQNGTALLHASQDLRDDKDIVLAAIERTKWSFNFASSRLKKDPDVRAMAGRTDPSGPYAYELDGIVWPEPAQVPQNDPR